jgi:hypothetical protein
VERLLSTWQTCHLTPVFQVQELDLEPGAEGTVGLQLNQHVSRPRIPLDEFAYQTRPLLGGGGEVADEVAAERFRDSAGIHGRRLPPCFTHECLRPAEQFADAVPRLEAR